MNFSSMSTSIADQSMLTKGASRASADLTRLHGRLDMKASGQSKEAMREGLRAASKEFEAIFVYQMISAMRQTIGENSMMPKSNGEQIFEGMLDEEWSKKLAGTNGPGGLSEVLYRQLSRQMGLEEETPVPRTDADLGDGASLLRNLQSRGLQIAPGTVLKDAR